MLIEADLPPLSGQLLIEPMYHDRNAVRFTPDSGGKLLAGNSDAAVAEQIDNRLPLLVR
jgi:hypothetical protein